MGNWAWGLGLTILSIFLQYAVTSMPRFVSWGGVIVGVALMMRAALGSHDWAGFANNHPFAATLFVAFGVIWATITVGLWIIWPIIIEEEDERNSG
jgi:hypothetical protein